MAIGLEATTDTHVAEPLGRFQVRALYERWARRTCASRKRPRARTILWQTLLGYALVQVGVAAWLLTAGASWRDPVFSARLERLQRQHRLYPERPVVIVVGSSRLLQGFEPELAEAAALEQGRPFVVGNFASPGAGPLTQRLALERVLRAGVRPDLVVLEALPGLLHRPVEDEFNDSRLPTRKMRAYDLPLIQRYAGATRSGVAWDFWIDWLSPIYSQRFLLVHGVSPKLLPLHLQIELGPEYWAPAYMQARYEDYRRRLPQVLLNNAHKEVGAFVPHFRIGDPGCVALFELAEQCRRRGLNPLVVFTPEGPTFSSWYTDASRRETEQFAQRLENDCGVPVVRAGQWLPNEEYFADSHHMMAKGAHAFTPRFVREGIVPALERRREAPTYLVKSSGGFRP